VCLAVKTGPAIVVDGGDANVVLNDAGDAVLQLRGMKEG
jgi:Fe-S cluster biogenesis protein NfuA